MPPIVTTILGFVQLALAAAPEVAKVYADARKLFKMWFDGGLITAAEQDALRSWAEAHQAATLSGQRPPELVIDED